MQSNPRGPGSGPPRSNPRHPRCVTLGKFLNFSETQRLSLPAGCKESRCVMGIMNLMRAGVGIKETTQVTVYIFT